MKTTGIPQVSALLAALALALPACVQDTEIDAASPETVATAAAAPEAQVRGEPGRHGFHKGKLEFVKQRFEKADQNSDGKVTRQELDASIAARFAEMDADGDGALNADELAAMKGKHHGKWLKKLDANSDGVLSRDEAPPRLARHFDKVDADGNGSLSESELAAAHQRRRGGHKRGPARMDADADGTVSLDEFSQHSVRWFERADADGDDAVTLQELESKAKAMRGHRRGKGKKGRRGMRLLKEADANDDGQITKAEVQALRSAKFDELDQNGDGVLSAEERPAMHRKRGKAGGKGLKRIDQDGDGQVSKDEFMAMTDRLFERLDANDDDVISRDELKAARFRGRKGRPGPGAVGP